MNNYHKRINELRSYMLEKSISLSIVTDPDHQYFLTGFKAFTYSRPITLLIDEKRTQFIIPSLEENHAHKAVVDDLQVYFEYEVDKGSNSYFTTLKNAIESVSSQTLALDIDSAPITLTQYVIPQSATIKDIGQRIVEMRYIKEDEEIEHIREASRWINQAMQVSLQYSKPGVSELEIDDQGNSFLYSEIPKTHPNSTIQIIGMSPSGTERSVMPHVFSNSRKLQKGDVMIHTRQVGIDGYRTELERTIFIGEPTNKQKKAFNTMVEAQSAAIEALKPGVRAGDIDDIARNIFIREGYKDYAVHRTGHGIGLSPHEEPYIRFDNDLIIQERMVFTIEPGIYIPNVGGFRHSDTLVVSRYGCEWLTDYPRDLESLIL
ncbi:aminopeptidase P family protein [Salicibibacter cibi]|uniref:Aminopeptidase P family protein n=1 Tax=Salicibibacter cibi TaxID=2743001 RepID=A0A7T6ZBR2_9BACI|nr:Xaa-Pro peptidase family protein [Salicibibacter cibi]QQK80412.1 aminopeptidase P family protein [Salicibibacter cibi]